MHSKTNMHPKTKNILQVNIGTVFVAMAPLFAKLINLPADITILYRCILSAMFLFVFLKLKRAKLTLEKKEYKHIIILGSLLAFHWVTFYLSIKASTVAIGMISLFTFPIMVVLIEPFITKEKIQVIDILSAIVVFFGIILIVPEFSFQNSYTQGILWGLASALFMALRNIFSKKYVSKYSGSIVMFYQVFTGAAILSPLLLFQPAVPTQTELFHLIFLSLVVTVVGHTLIVSGLKHLKAATVSIIASVQPVYSIIFAVIVLSEIPNIKTMIGAVIILATVIIENIRHKK